MKITKSQIHTNKAFSPNFQGRVAFDEALIPKMIEKMEGFERRKIETKLLSEEQRNAPIVKESLKKGLRKFFLRKKIEPQKPATKKGLLDFWNESLNEIKNIITTKLPDEYTLNSKNSNLTPNLISFRLTRGQEYIYGVSTSLANPNFPLKCIKDTVKIISNPEFKKTFKEFKEIIPELTENKFVTHNQEFTNPIALKWVEINKELNRQAAEKNLKVSINLNENKYGQYTLGSGTIKTKKGENIYSVSASYNFSDFEKLANELSQQLKTL